MSIGKYSINLNTALVNSQLFQMPHHEIISVPNLSKGNTPFEFKVNVVSTLPISTPKLIQLQSMMHDLQQLMQPTENRWPDHKVPRWCLPYWLFHDQISFNDGISIKGEKS